MAIGTISNGESGSSVRTKLNSTIGVANKTDIIDVALGSNGTAVDCESVETIYITGSYTANTTTTFSNVAKLRSVVFQLTNTNANTITFAGLTFEFKDSELPDGVSFATNALTFPADSSVKYNIVGVRFDGTNMRAKIEIN